MNRPIENDVRDNAGTQADTANDADYFDDLIYVVDDEPVMTKVLAYYLSADGFTNVVQLSDGLEAVDALKATPPDLLITDLMMPDASGKYLMHLIENDDSYQAIPVIAISGTDDPEVGAAALRAGAIDFLQKPIDSESLIGSVRHACIQRRRLDSLAATRIRATRSKALQSKELKLRGILGR